MIGFLMILIGAILGGEVALVVIEPGPLEVGCLVFVAAMFLFNLVIWNDSR